MNRYKIRIFAEGKELYFENEDKDIKVEINEELMTRYLNLKNQLYGNCKTII